MHSYGCTSNAPRTAAHNATSSDAGSIGRIAAALLFASIAVAAPRGAFAQALDADRSVERPAATMVADARDAATAVATLADDAEQAALPRATIAPRELGTPRELGAPRIVIAPQPRRRPSVLTPLYLSFAALQGLDVATTMRALNGGAVEANPAMAPVVKSPAVFIGVKALTSAAMIASTEQLWKHHRTAAVLTMVGANVGYSLVVAHNARVLSHVQ
jgi:hypothetical protein